jgi:hypothetical protein
MVYIPPWQTVVRRVTAWYEEVISANPAGLANTERWI